VLTKVVDPDTFKFPVTDKLFPTVKFVVIATLSGRPTVIDPVEAETFTSFGVPVIA
jgi:hypothetical protein